MQSWMFEPKVTALPHLGNVLLFDNKKVKDKRLAIHRVHSALQSWQSPVTMTTELHSVGISTGC